MNSGSDRTEQSIAGTEKPVSTDFDPQVQKKSRRALLAMIGMVVLPVVVSCFIYFTGIGMPEGTVNRGQLVSPPVDLSVLKMTDQNGLAWDWRDEGPVFKLVQVLASQVLGGSEALRCSDACESWMHTARQVDTRLGKESNQVMRVFVYSGQLSAELENTILTEYPNMKLLSAETVEWQSLLPAPLKMNAEQLFIVDRRSHLVMAYDDSNQGGDLLKDLKHLVKIVQ